jgi:lipid-A-disaccharide synthase
MVIAGEASGDRIAAPVLRALRTNAAEHGIALKLIGIGGDEARAAGLDCVVSAKDMSVVGFVEVARRFRFFRSVFRRMVALLDAERPSALLLIDYPGFNIRLAKEAKKRGIRVVYYVSPQVWAWHASRIHELKRVVDEMLVLFPFEEKLYREAGLPSAHFVGHPLVEAIDKEREHFQSREAFARAHGLDPNKCWLLVFSGSRSEEVRRLLPVMSEAAERFAREKEMEAIVVETPAIDEAHYTEYLRVPLKRFRDPARTHELMHHADLGILKSGTTTLEAGLLGLPGVICYRTHPLTFALGKRLVKLSYIGLVNIVLGRKLYPELLQHDVTVDKIITELNDVIARDAEFIATLAGLEQTLRGGGKPSERVAEALLR